MKKILLASTALVVSAGFATAEVVVGGDGYFGIMYGEGDEGIFSTPESRISGEASDQSSFAFAYDLDIDFAVTLQSDSGLSFGMKTDLDDNASGSQGARGFEGEIFVSGDFGKLTMGDISGGAEVVVGDLAGVGLTGLGDLNENIFLLDATALNRATARYDYSVSGISLSLAFGEDESYALGVGYGTDLFTVGLGYESVEEGRSVTLIDTDILGGRNIGSTSIGVTLEDTATHIIGGASVTFSDVTVKATYGQIDVDSGDIDKVDQYGISVGTSFGAASVAAYYRAIDVSFLTAGREDREGQFYGLGGAYDLGGGLSLKAGVAQADVDGLDDNVTVADFGVAINF